MKRTVYSNHAVIPSFCDQAWIWADYYLDLLPPVRTVLRLGLSPTVLGSIPLGSCTASPAGPRIHSPWHLWKSRMWNKALVTARNLSNIGWPVLVRGQGVVVRPPHAVCPAGRGALRAPSLPLTGVLCIAMTPKSLHAGGLCCFLALERLPASDILSLQTMNFRVKLWAYCLFSYNSMLNAFMLLNVLWNMTIQLILNLCIIFVFLMNFTKHIHFTCVVTNKSVVFPCLLLSDSLKIYQLNKSNPKILLQI